MQDCGEDLVRIIKNGKSFEVEFTSRATGRKIVLHVPTRMGRDDPDGRVTEWDVEQLAREIAQVFRAKVI